MLHRQLVRSDRPDNGETLVEVLVAVTIIGIAAVALLGALVTSWSSSSEHRGFASMDTVARSFAEASTYEIEQQSSPWFTNCATVSGMSYSGNAVLYSPPAGYSVTFSSIQYWNSSTQQFDPAGSPCGSNDQSGFQLLTIQVTGPNAAGDMLSFGVRSP